MPWPSLPFSLWQNLKLWAKIRVWSAVRAHTWSNMKWLLQHRSSSSFPTIQELDWGRERAEQLLRNGKRYKTSFGSPLCRQVRAAQSTGHSQPSASSTGRRKTALESVRHLLIATHQHCQQDKEVAKGWPFTDVNPIMISIWPLSHKSQRDLNLRWQAGPPLLPPVLGCWHQHSEIASMMMMMMIS